MTNFAKIVISAGLIGLGCLVFVLFKSQEHEAQSELFKARHEQQKIEFNREFDSDWNQGMLDFADTQAERDRIAGREKTQQERYATDSERVSQRIDEAQAKVDRTAQVTNEFNQGFEEAIRDTPEISDEEFSKAMRELN